MNALPPVIIVSNYSLPSRVLYRYRGIKYARYGLTLRAQVCKEIQAAAIYRNYDVRGPTVHTVQFQLTYKF